MEEKGKFCVKGIAASGMVLQRNKINSVYGSAGVYEDIIMTFRGLTCITQSDEFGKWKIEFSPGEAGGPFEMSIKCGTEKVTFTDIYVGEVWVSSGQSNAQLQMERLKFSYPEEMKLPENPNIRMITIPITWSFKGEQDKVENPQWMAASPDTLKFMSGTAYFFAKKLHEELGVPVGIISTAQGGSPIASWMSKQALQEVDAKDYLERLAWFENDDNISAKQKELAENQSAWDTELQGARTIPDCKCDACNSAEGWETVKIPGIIESFDSAGLVWLKKEIELTKEQVANFDAHRTWLWMGTIVDADEAFVNGVRVGGTGYSYPPRRYEVPAGVLQEGKNIIAMHVQLNSKRGRIKFFEEKPYCLFTDNVYVNPVVCRNVEVKRAELFPVDGELISLAGDWQMKVDCKVRDCPPGMFFEWVPTALYNSMLAPCFRHTIAGALWYQGESDAGHAAEYKGMLTKMIDLWRRKFIYGSKDLPFVVMQLPNWSDGNYQDSTISKMDWPYLRQAQADAAEIAGKTGLAVTIDAGEWNDLHPEKKKTGGTRAALEALRVAYGKSYISPAPKMVSCTAEKTKYIVRFDCGNSSLVAHSVNEYSADLNTEAADKSVYGFSFLKQKKGEMIVEEADAVLVSDNEVEVSIPKGGDLLELRYLWADSPKVVNLYSRDQLPAMPFMVKIVF